MHCIVKVARSRLVNQVVPSLRLCSKYSSQSPEIKVENKSSDSKQEDTEDTEPAPTPDPLQLKDEEIKVLQAELAEITKLVDDVKGKYLRALADGENIRNRSKKELADSKIFSIQSFAKELLPVSDVLEKALESVTEEERTASKTLSTLHKGVYLTHNQLHQVFKRHNLVKIEPLEEVFDPVYHEAMFQVPDPTKTPGTVMSVIQSGYVLHSRSIRPAKVGVVKDT